MVAKCFASLEDSHRAKECPSYSKLAHHSAQKGALKVRRGAGKAEREKTTDRKECRGL